MVLSLPASKGGELMGQSDSGTKILVIGAGAVGGYFGGKLCRTDRAQVTFAARGDTLAALRDHGLAVKSIDGDFEVPSVDAAPLEEIDRRFDYVLLCVKAYHLPEVLPRLQDVVAERCAVLPLLNGLGSEEQVSTTVGASRAFGAVAYVGAHAPEPATVVHTDSGRIAIGPLPGPPEPEGSLATSPPEPDQRLEVFAELCRAADVRCDISPNIGLDLWRKLAWNAAVSAVTALGRASVGETLAVSSAETLIRAAMLEVIMVGQSHGIPLDPSDVDSFIEHARGADVRTSMEIDADLGRRVEADAINGAVVARGRDVGLPTPVNQTLHSLLKILDERALASSS
jgi:2-dehydropantoate 2-reductase